jgi:UDP-N-acetylmuramyl pentapeptide synthase
VPDIAIITILGDQHLERFGSQANLVKGKSEIFTTNSRTKCYVTNDSLEQIKRHNIATDQLITVEVPTNQKSTTYLVKQLALELGVSPESIDASIASFTPPERRNNIIERQGVTIIDNSYNISPMVAKVMLNQAAATAKKQGKMLVVMTGGIGEQGIAGPVANKHLGELVSQYAKRAILHPSIYAQPVEAGLTIPFVYTAMGLDVSEKPADWLDGQNEILLWLTDHGDEAYF